MKQDIYIFNPQNDLALATGGINYVAPPFAMQMATDLAVLPAFIAESGSRLITDSDLDSQWMEHLNTTLGLDIHAIKRNELHIMSDYRIIPWGWCLDLRRRLIKWGAQTSALPTKDHIYNLRGLSHRRISVLIHQRINQLSGIEYCPQPVELATPAEVISFVKRHKQCFIKTPWSSSGRGIYHTTGGTSPEFEQWCSGSLKRQGSLLCEIAMNKIMDLAVEFYSDNGTVQSRGLSVFATDAHSQYEQGLVATTSILSDKIIAQYPQFSDVVEHLTQVVNELVAPHYNGWLGVDMLLFKNPDGTIGINPCVELNLRTTMGAVTSVLGNNILAEGRQATFKIEQRNSSSTPWPKHDEPAIENKRLGAGTLILTPDTPTALYRATLSVKSEF